jgi:hypothetical protein
MRGEEIRVIEKTVSYDPPCGVHTKSITARCTRAERTKISHRSSNPDESVRAGISGIEAVAADFSVLTDCSRAAFAARTAANGCGYSVGPHAGIRFWIEGIRMIDALPDGCPGVIDCEYVQHPAITNVGEDSVLPDHWTAIEV